MAFGKAFSRFLIFVVVILMVGLIPFVHSSRTRLHDGTTVAEHTATAAQDFEGTIVEGLGKVSASVAVIEDSQREVPTGPDPLHHNNRPSGP